MSNAIMIRALALCALVSISFEVSRAVAQAPGYGTQASGRSTAPQTYGTQPPATNPSQGYGQTQYPSTAGPPATTMGPYAPRTGQALPANHSYPTTSTTAYPDTRTATRTSVINPSLGTSTNSSMPNAGIGNAGAIPNGAAPRGAIPFPDNQFSGFDNQIQPVGHVTTSSQDCACDKLGRYHPDCDSCSGKACLFPECVGGFRIGGWLQQGLTANFGDPNDRMNSPVLFNDRSNDYQLNQLYLYAEREIQNDGYQWELGGRLDVMLGSDARFLTVPGLEEHQDGTPKWNGENKQYGMAIPQAYLELAAPFLHGVSLKAGHFYSIAGYETAAAPQNFFYSHAYTFLYGEPFTHTGALFTAKPNQVMTVSAGYTKGWDVLESNSNEYGILASVKFTSLDKRTSVAATVHSGQDVTGVRAGGALIDEDRHFISLVLQHQINDCLRYVFQHDFGYQEDGEVVVNIGPRTITFDEAKWYGINQYLIYDFDDTLSAALRVEWFRDQDHSRLAVPVKFNPGGTTFLGGNYFAVTGGVNWRPNGNITVRPEIRWDYSDLQGNGGAPGGNPAVRAFDDARESNQLTAAVDVVISY